MQLTEKERDLLVDTLIESLWQFPLEGTHRSVREMIIHKAIMPNVEGILADRAVPEPDADMVRVDRLGSILRMEYARGYQDAKKEMQVRTFSSTTINNTALQAAVVEPDAAAAMPSSADDNWLDAALAALTTDGLPGKTLSIYRHDGQWGAQQHMTHLEEQYPTDICGHGDGVLEAIANAVDNAKKEATQ